MEATMLWKELRATGDDSVREQLLARHLPLVHHVARRMQRSLARDADINDLVSAGTIGLVDAVESFDPGRGLAFSTYAAPRIQGAILDDLRRWDHAPRSVRRKQRDIARAEERLTRTLGRAPSQTEVATELDIDMQTLWDWQATTEDAVRVSLDQPLADDDPHAASPLDILAGSTGAEIEDGITSSEEVELLKAEIGRLREQERVVLSLYFFQELKLHQIAQVLGLTESRISQIRTKALNTLRSRMAHLREAPL
jgi:RNA polymerase sigma factor FliA